MIRDARYWIETLRLQPHPEGGYYHETYRSADEIRPPGLPHRFPSARSCSTAIYFLLEAGQVSVFHRIASDEMWHHYAGSALTLHVIDPEGGTRSHLLGPDAENGEAFQVVIPAGHWFGATVNAARGHAGGGPDAAFALVGCTVAPGFCFDDFELADRATLVARYPQHRTLIEQLTRLPD